jgi:uncharacterized protein
MFMFPDNSIILVYLGLVIGLLSGLLGIGGGTLLLPLLTALGYTPLQSVATSSLALVMTAMSATVRNWSIGCLNLEKIAFLAAPSILFAPLGVYLAHKLPSYLLFNIFGLYLIINIFLVNLRKNLALQTDQNKPLTLRISLNVKTNKNEFSLFNFNIAHFLAGGISGFLAGLFGIGGGAIMVPLQMLLLGEKIKIAIQTSLGVILVTSISNCVIYAQEGNILLNTGMILGIAGLFGAQVSSYYLPKLPDKFINIIFNAMLALVAANMFWQAGINYSKMSFH